MESMFVKQIDMTEALRLAAQGQEIKVLVPTGPGAGWESLEPDTLKNMLADVLFFRNEPAMDNCEIDRMLRDTPPVDKNKSGSGDPGVEDKPSADSGPKRAKRIDTGKLLALHKAGWSQKKIAEELKVAPSTVCTYLKKAEEELSHEETDG